MSLSGEHGVSAHDGAAATAARLADRLDAVSLPQPRTTPPPQPRTKGASAQDISSEDARFARGCEEGRGDQGRDSEEGAGQERWGLDDDEVRTLLSPAVARISALADAARALAERRPDAGPATATGTATGTTDDTDLLAEIARIAADQPWRSPR